MPRGTHVLPSFVPPALASPVEVAPAEANWLHEIKFDGYRTAGRLLNGRATLLTRAGHNWTARFPTIADELKYLRTRSAYLDEEIVALDPAGISDFSSLQEALSSHKPDALVYFVFDLLHLDGGNLTGLPLLERKVLLKRLLASVAAPHVKYSDHFEGRGRQFFEQACHAGLEGIVSKRASSHYRSGRVGDWLKVKCIKRQEFVVGGWRPLEARGREVASLLLGYHDKGKFIYAGKVGTGFSAQLAHSLAARLSGHSLTGSPFVDVPRVDARDTRWIEPRVVVEIEFAEWTRDGRVRYPSFKGVREDKKAPQVRREKPRLGHSVIGRPARSAG
jgi:bifunctional non-homologous end joining protein LigD